MKAKQHCRVSWYGVVTAVVLAFAFLISAIPLSTPVSATGVNCFDIEVPVSVIGDGTPDLTFGADASGCDVVGIDNAGHRITLGASASGKCSLSVTCSVEGDGYLSDDRVLELEYDVTVGSDGNVTATKMNSFFNIGGEAVGEQTAFSIVKKSSPTWSESTVAEAREIMDGMSLDERIGQLFLVHYPDRGAGSIAQADEVIESYHPAGFLCFAAMFEGSTPSVVRSKTLAAQRTAKIPMLFTIDEEGGSVVRASKYTAFRSQKYKGQRELSLQGADAVYNDAVDKAWFLLDLGFNVNHAPVADVSDSGGYIYSRTYGGDGLYNSDFVAAAIEGHEVSGVATTMKHFPGYGSTSSNTHNGFAINYLSLDEFRYNDLLPFYAGINAGGKGVMVTHNIINAMDPENPASLSPAVISYLRDEMGFDGIVVTDDLNMGAVLEAAPGHTAALRALQAGCDLAMVEDYADEIAVVKGAVTDGTLSMDRVEESVMRVLCWKIDMGIMNLGDIPEPDFEASLSAVVDGQAYEANGTLADMCSMANGSTGGIVTLFKDVDLFNKPIVCNKNSYTINLNGHHVTTENNQNVHSIQVTGNVELTIEDRDAETGLINEPVISRSVVGSLPTDAESRKSTLSTWNLQKASWNDAMRMMTYHTVEEGNPCPVKMRYRADLSGVGSIVSKSTTRYLFNCTNGGRLNVKGGYYSVEIWCIFNVSGSGANRSTLSFEDAWLINSEKVGDVSGLFELHNCHVVNNINTNVHINGKQLLYAGDGNNGMIVVDGTVIANNMTTNTAEGFIIGARNRPLEFRNSMITCNVTTSEMGPIGYLYGSNNAFNMTDCVISGNYGGKTGTTGDASRSYSCGGIYIMGTTTGTVIDRCKIIANFAASGVGIRHADGGNNSSIVVRDTDIKYNYSTNAAAAVLSVKSKLSLDGCDISDNMSRTLAGAVHLSESSLSCHGTTMNDNTVITNGTSSLGGAIYAAGKNTLTLDEVTITGNHASDGAGIYANSQTAMNVRGKIVIDDNRMDDMSTENNLSIENGGYLYTIGAVTEDSSIGIHSRTVPTESTVVIVMDGEHATGMEEIFSSDIASYYIYENNGGIVLGLSESVAPNVDFDGVMFQYYINLRTPVMYDASAVSLQLLSMEKGNLPKNGQGAVAQYLYLDPATGEIKMKTKLTEMYSYRTIPLKRCTSINVVNRFTDLDKLGWDLYELWVLKPGKKQFSTNRKDWTIYEYTDDFDIAALELKEKDCVRLVCNPKESEKSLDATFYDYDVTDGNVYSSLDDAVSKNNPSGMSTYDKSRRVYLSTRASGINSAENVAGQAGVAQYAFGNANHGTDFIYDTVSDKYTMNKYNNGTLLGCYFGLVTGLDEDYNLVWKRDLKAPNIFGGDDGTIGKSVFDDYLLNFKRIGSTYTIEDVLRTDGDGNVVDVLTDLNTMNNPVYGSKVWDAIWTNNFWPMDGNGIIGTDGHDPLEGAYDTHENGLLYHTQPQTGKSDYNYPSSDDGVDHNAFFGMHMALNFSLTEDYTAPLEYYFFGDDDMWVFLDGELICDIGGVHSSVGAYVNIRQYIEVGDTDTHRFDIYYTERGASGSTCWMQFTLPATLTDVDYENFIFGKIDQLGHDVQGAVFSLYSDPECSNELSNHVSDLSGTVCVTGLSDDNTYYVKETYAPDGYVLSDTVYELSKVDGEWMMYRKDDPDKASVTDVVNEDISIGSPVEMPETGGHGTLPVISAGTCLIVLAFVLSSRHKKRNTCP